MQALVDGQWEGDGLFSGAIDAFYEIGSSFGLQFARPALRACFSSIPALVNVNNLRTRSASHRLIAGKILGTLLIFGFYRVLCRNVPIVSASSNGPKLHALFCLLVNPSRPARCQEEPFDVFRKETNLRSTFFR